MAQIAKIVALTGQAYVVGADGLLRALKVGDSIEKGEIIRTAEGARVELMMTDGQTVAVAPGTNVRVDESMVQADSRPGTPESAVQEASVEAVIQALDRGDDLNQTLDPAAAGLGAGAESGGDATFVRLLRITEPVDPLAYNYALSPLPTVRTVDPAILPETTVQPIISVRVTDTPLPQETDGAIAVSPEVIALSASGLQVLEGTGTGSKVVHFLFTLDKVALTDITITFVLRPGSASAGTDFTDGTIGTPVTATIPAGVNGFVIPVNIVMDAGVEGNETFNIELLSATGATLGATTAEVTIVDDDILLTPAANLVDETGGLDQASGNLNLIYNGTGSTPVIALSAEGATWDPDNRTLTDDNGHWQTTIDANGSYIFTQLTAMTHPVNTNPDDTIEISITATASTSVVVNGVTTTSTATSTIVVTVRDDGPAVTLQTEPITAYATLDETDGLDTVTLLAANVTDMFASSAFGQDGEGTALYKLNAINGASTGLYLTSDPDHLHEIRLVRISDTQYEGWSDGNTSTGTKAFTISIDGLAGTVTVTQNAPLDHPLGEDAYDDAVGLVADATVWVSLTVTDADGDKATAGSSSATALSIVFKDDGPTLTVSANAGAATAMALNLDETAGATDRYASGEATDTAITDDAGGTIARQTTAVSGGLSTLFTINASTGTDGGTPATGGTLSLQLLGATEGKLATSLTTVDGGLVSLEMSGASVVGKDTLGHTVLSIAIVGDQLQVSLLEPLNHGTDGSTAYDEVLTLLTVGTGSALQLVYTVTQTDADGDSITRSASVDLAGTATSALSFDDDGPTLTVSANAGAATAMAMNLDETAGATDRYASGEASDTAVTDDAGGTIARQTTAVSGGLSTLFTINASTGTDGGTPATGGTLSLQLLGATEGKLATSLTTVDGGLVSLEMSGASVVGKDTLGHTVLSIAIVGDQLQVSLLEPLNHGTDGSTAYDEVLTLLTVGTDSALQLVYTVTQTDADGDSITRSASVDLAGTATSALSFDDDGPTLVATDPDTMAFNLSSTTTSSPVSGTYTLDTGADTATFGTSFGGSGALVWNNKPDGYTFVQTDSTWNGTTDHSLTWTAYDQDDTALFEVTLDDSGQYQFRLLSPIGPEITSTENLMSNISGGSNLASYDFAASIFGGAFILQVDGKEKSGANFVDSTVTISSTELGVAGNSIQPDSEKLVLKVLQQPGYEDASIARIYMSMADTGGLKAGDSFTYQVFYADGSTQTYTEVVPEDPDSLGNPGTVVFDNFDPSRVVTRIEIWTTDGGATWKVDGFSVDYYKNVSANDSSYAFTLTGQDGDGDAVSTSFTVDVGVGTAGADNLLGGTGDNLMSAGAGDDVVFGGKGNDVIDGGSGMDTIQGGIGNDAMTGGLGADVFKWTLGDVGTVGAPALDTVEDFEAGVGGDALDLRDLLDLNGGGTAGNGWTGTDLDLATALKAFVQITDTGSSLQLTIDTNGVGTPDGASTSTLGAVQTIVLEGVHASMFGVNATGTMSDAQVQTILKQMLTDGNLKHD